MASNNMMKFEFSSTESKFIGRIFYDVYKKAEFLRSSDNVELILSRGHELRQSLKKVAPGQTIVIQKMCLERNTPLLVKNTFGANVAVEDFEFTYNRLTGLTAAYAYENRHRFPIIKSSESAALGLVWDNSNDIGCKLYLSAVSGTEHFPQQFSFFPLVCALRKLQMKKITVPPVVKIARIKNDDGERMSAVLMKNLIVANELWRLFGGQPTANVNLQSMLSLLPQELKKVFLETPK